MRRWRYHWRGATGKGAEGYLRQFLGGFPVVFKLAPLGAPAVYTDGDGCLRADGEFAGATVAVVWDGRAIEITMVVDEDSPAVTTHGLNAYVLGFFRMAGLSVGGRDRPVLYGRTVFDG